MAALARQTSVMPRAAAAPRRAAAKAPTGSPLASRVPSHPAVALRPRRGAGAVCGMAATEVAQVALELNSETITIVLSAIAGIGAGLGIPIFFVMQEKRDKERLEAGRVPDCLLIVYQCTRSAAI